jgi:hypothetical protein
MASWRSLLFEYFDRTCFFGEIFVSFWKLQPLLRKSTKFVLEFCGLDLLGTLALVDIATLSCFNRAFLRILHEPLALLSQRFYRKKLSPIWVKEKFLNNAAHIHLIAIVMKTQATTHCCLKLFPVEIPSWMGFWATTCCLRPFRWESLRGWDFRPQLVVVSGLFGGNPLHGWDFRP